MKLKTGVIWKVGLQSQRMFEARQRRNRSKLLQAKIKEPFQKRMMPHHYQLMSRHLSDPLNSKRHHIGEVATEHNLVQNEKEDDPP
jgi:hypothetical protein